MKNHKSLYLTLIYLNIGLIVLSNFLQFAQVESSPILNSSSNNNVPSSEFTNSNNGHQEGEVGHHHVVQDVYNKVKGIVKADDDGSENNDKGLSTMDYVYIGLGVLAVLIILSCIISYLFCACVKEIICLPCTCLQKVLCCCCD